MIELYRPSSASSILKRANTSDDFPDPVLPTSPILSPAEMVRLIDFRTGSRSGLKENAFGQVLGERVSDHFSCFSDYSRDQLEYWLPIGTNGVAIPGSKVLPGQEDTSRKVVGSNPGARILFFS